MTQKKKIIPRDKNIGNQLRKLRKKYRLSVEALADIANVDYKTIWNCENGYNSLTLDLLIKISPAFRDGNVDLASLFDFLVIQAIELETVNHYS
ncbi:helix-turn-helix transcriptional regulator (plasmid) [Lactiplantibacillus plantarum]|nr:helix-turn-helix transcriptional regulator [Lactiplantibacillus plantarum]WEZ96327.1 helix-turn-helix transcriptional regulator [Lactiplantibacillus plantarum]